MEKKVTAIILCAVMLFCLSACGASEMMGKIRGETGVKTSKGSDNGSEYDAGRPADEPEEAALKLTLHSCEKLKLEDSNTYDLDNVFIGWTITYPEDLPEEMLAKLVEMKDGYLPGGDGSYIISLGKANRGTWVSYTVEINCEMFEEGFYSVSSYITNNINDTLRWDKYNILSCFDSEFNKQSLSNIFEDFFDYRSYLLNGLREYWMLSYGSNENFLQEQSGEGGELPEDYASEVFKKGSFTLTEDSLVVATSPIGIIEKTPCSDEIKNYSAPLILSISYSDIGASKLKIF